MYIWGDLSRFRIATKYFSLPSQDCDYKDLWPDPGIQQRIRFPDSGLQQIIQSSGVSIAIRMLIPPVSGLRQKDLWPDSGNQQRVSFPESGLQQKIHFSRVRIAMKHLSLQRIAPSFFHASRVRIATELLSPPESELQQKDLWQDAGIQQRGRFPDSRLQQIIHLSRISNNKDRWAGNKNISSSRVRITTIGNNPPPLRPSEARIRPRAGPAGLSRKEKC